MEIIIPKSDGTYLNFPTRRNTIEMLWDAEIVIRVFRPLLLQGVQFVDGLRLHRRRAVVVADPVLWFLPPVRLDLRQPIGERRRSPGNEKEHNVVLGEGKINGLGVIPICAVCWTTSCGLLPLVINDLVFVYVSNALGVILAFAQLVLMLVSIDPQ
ncbi:hypothetical protein ZIOFF_017194 [Zingiber officinale]|uniref:Uncharacterized protein n=1 Tax=Zingiber officinale TaxID=94328 RepID=A0A8J5HNE0_ZINOF|nr:hypothetical protein ZIOFF_017194 [Zingiber officinale]